MGRLENIIDRNRHPGRYRKRRGLVGIGLATIVVFVALILLIFTDLASPQEAPSPPAPAGKAEGVRGVPLMRQPAKKPAPPPAQPAQP